MVEPQRRHASDYRPGNDVGGIVGPSYSHFENRGVHLERKNVSGMIAPKFRKECDVRFLSGIHERPLG